MKATALIKAQHKTVDKLFEKLESADDQAKRSSLFEELGATLVAHDAMEREIFYPACEAELGLTDILGESLVEHGLVEFSLYQADQTLDTEDFKFKCTVLKEVVEHHVEDEEKELLPQVDKAFDSERLEELGDEMQARFEQAMSEDFREALHSNLEQVLAGATKTEPEAPKGKSKKAPEAKKAAPHKGNGHRAQHRTR